ncbi:hypothetical protein D3C84_711930 [compost metagenome]
MRIGADQGVRIGEGGAVVVAAPHHLGEVLQIDLVADAGARRHHPEVGEGLLAPAQEGIALVVALHLDGHVVGEGAGVGEAVDHHRVVDHQVHRRQRIDLLRIAAGAGHGIAHGGQIDHPGHAGEVLHQHPRRTELDFLLRAALVQPLHHRPAVGGGHAAAVLAAQQVLQQQLERDGQLPDIAEVARGVGQAEILVGAAVDLKVASAVETVRVGHAGVLQSGCAADGAG